MPSDKPTHSAMEATEMLKNVRAAELMPLVLALSSSSLVFFVLFTASESTLRMEIKRPPSACRV